MATVKSRESLLAAIKCLGENIKMSADDQTPEGIYQYNLHKGLFNLATAVAELQKDLDSLRREIKQPDRE